jgi:hypothetical protein
MMELGLGLQYLSVVILLIPVLRGRRGRELRPVRSKNSENKIFLCWMEDHS